MAEFVTWYNHAHRHSEIGLHTPADVHHGRHHLVRAGREETLAADPERFGTGRPLPTLLELPEVHHLRSPVLSRRMTFPPGWTTEEDSSRCSPSRSVGRRVRLTGGSAPVGPPIRQSGIKVSPRKSLPPGVQKPTVRKDTYLDLLTPSSVVSALSV